MNFDMNTLSALMQLMSAQKTQSAPPNNCDSDYNYDTRANYGYNNGQSRNSTDGYANASKTTASVFAMQNGLGQRIEFGTSPQPKKQTFYNNAANPMAALIEMMTGKSGGNGDMMSNLMPMLMNIMSGKNTQNAQNSAQNQNKTNGRPNGNTNDKNGNTVPAADNAPTPETNINNRNNCENATDKNIKEYAKTQPASRDKYEPIAFAGYALISALNKLFVSKRIKR